MASVERLPSGKWRGIYRDGAGRKRSRTFLHKVAAQHWAEDAEERVRSGRDPAAPSMPLREWAHRWHEARVVERTTAASDDGRLERILDEFGDVPLDRLDALELQGWVKRMQRDGRSPGTVRKYHNLLSAMLAAAVASRVLAENPCRFVQLPALPPGRQVYLTREEVEAVAAALRPPYDTVTVLLPYLGTRWGELAGLPVAAVDLLRRTVDVRQVLIEIDGRRELKPYPKNSPSARTVPVPSRAGDAIAAYLAEHRRDRDDLLLRGARGEPLSRHHYSRTFKRALDRAGVVKPARPHDLRHSGASWLAQAGVPLFDVQRWLGHSSLATTMRYAHHDDAALAPIRAALDAAGRGTKRGTGNANHA